MTEERSENDQPDPPAAGKVIRTQELFGAEKEIVIDHDGERYKLRITRRGKLILQK